MKFSTQWLQEWVKHSLTAEQVAEQLTMAGLEIEAVEPVAGDFNKVVIGEVLVAEQHPNADRLRVCQVNVGQATPLNIVCGAANMRAGLKVPVALDGGKVQGHAIKTAKLRGVVSQGMICSAKELGLQETSEGILELPLDAPISQDFREWLQLNDWAIDIHVTPNRGDCLSILGIAREVAVLNNCQLNLPAIANNKIDHNEKLNVEVLAPQACPNYLGRIIRGVNIKAVTPIWLQERLRRSGLRSIHPVVDVTNYVLLELGQPLHAFDLNKIAEKIIVRFAKPGETITLLNEQTVELDEQTLLITDPQKPLAIAGVMGGLSSAVSDTTTDVFLESAFFNPMTISGRTRQYAVESDAAYRYERGVDPTLALRALERATQLLLEIAGGAAGPITQITHEKMLPTREAILLRKSRIQKLLGMDIAATEIETILQRLGMQLNRVNEGWQIIAPSYRFDIALEADLIEEIIRIKGYEEVPQKQPIMALHFNADTEKTISLTRLRQALVANDYQEAITYSFVAPKLQALINPDENVLPLLNPISAELAVMRTSLWPGLITAAIYNANRQQMRIRLFETGLRFCLHDNELQQEPVLAGIVLGNRYPEQWGNAQTKIDFYDVKQDLQNLFALTGCAKEFTFAKGEHPALHPGQCSAIMRNGEKIGYLGALHPAVLQIVDLPGPVYVFELTLSAITAAKLPQFTAISKFPAIRRDISFWIKNEISYQTLLSCIKDCANELLKDVWLFDVYQDQQKNSATRSLAVGLLLQHPERTLVDDEVNQLMETIINTLVEKFAISLRE